MNIRIKQRDVSDCGAACLASIFRHYSLDIPIAKIRQKAGTDKKGTNVLGMIEAARSFGFEAKGVKGPFESLASIPLPAIAHMIVKERLHHYVVILGLYKKHIGLMDPADGQVHKRSHEAFKTEWTGVLILLLPSDTFKPVPGTNNTMRARLWVLLHPHREILIQALFGALVYTVLGLSTSIFIQKIVDFVIVDNNRKLLNLMSLGMVFLLSLRLFIGSMKSIFILRTGQMIDARLILGYYKHLMQLPQQFFDTMRIGEITSRIGDAVKIRVFINDISINLAVNLFMLLFSLILMFTYYWKLAVIMFLIVPLYLAIYLVSNRLNKKVQRKLMEDGAELESQLVESLNAVGTIKRFGLEDHANNKTEIRFIKLLRTVYRSGMNSLFSGTSTELISQGFTILLLWVGTGFVLDNRISPGELLSFYTLIGYFTTPVASFIGMNSTVQDALIAADRLFEIMDLEMETQPEENSIELNDTKIGDIRFEALSFRYGTRVQVFENLNLEIPIGKMTAIVGESGSGKSTLLALLHKIYPLNGGRILIGRYSLDYISKESLRRLIGVVPQQTHLFSGNIIDNIVVGEDEPDLQKVLDLCSKLGIDSFAESLPQGYNTPIGENGLSLSGGQRQRIAIARALYRDPLILILDEATSSLDSTSEKFVQKAISHFVKQGKTLIVIAHRLTTIHKADKIIVLKNGQVAEEGNHSRLMQAKGEYFALWNQYIMDNLVTV